MSSQLQNKKICFIQLSRSGDIIQTLIPIINLKKSHPEISITLVTRKKFAFNLLFLLKRFINEIILLSPFESNTINQNYTLKNNHISFFVPFWSKKFFDLVINFSYLPSASLLTKLTNAKHRLGGQMNEHGKIEISDDWGRFIYSVIMKGPQSPFNLVDIFHYSLGVKPSPVSIYLKKNDPNLKKYIIIHPFSSNSKKNWNIKRWFLLLSKLNESFPDYYFHIMGSECEEPLAEILIQESRKNGPEMDIRNYCGKDSIEKSLEAISNAQIFIGHDSFGGHLCSLTNTPIISISLGPVRPKETAPYSENNFIFVPKISCFPCNADSSCDHLDCHKQADIHIISQIAKFLISKDMNIYQNISLNTFENFSILQSSFHPQIGLFYSPLSSKDRDLNWVFNDFYIIMWSFLLRDVDIELPMPLLDSSIHQKLIDQKKFCELLFELMDYYLLKIEEFTNESLKEVPSKENLLKISHLFNDIDDQIRNILKMTPLFAASMDFFYAKRINVSSNNLSTMSIQISDIIIENINALKIFYELLNKCLDVSKRDKEQKIEYHPDH